MRGTRSELVRKNAAEPESGGAMEWGDLRLRI
jgi:hypothetical protein